jgi:LysM repeat protein
VTPPGEKDYEVLVPEGRGETFLAAYEAMPESEKTARLASVHTVRRGETLASIAARYGTTVEDLKASNNLKNTRTLSVGSQITVPNVPGEAPAFRDDSVQGTRRASRGSPYHVVRRGDTLSSISRAYGVSLKNVMEWNGMTGSSVLKPGTRLVVGRSASTTGTVRPAGKVHSSAAQQGPEAMTTTEGSTSAGLVSVPGGGQAPPDPTGAKVQYRVKRGDNLFRIALKYGTTVENLKIWNSITGDDIVAGAILIIYPN